MKQTLFLILLVCTSLNSKGQIVINEINYKDAIGFETKDWIELHNRSNDVINISNWVFKDSDDLHEFVIPNGTTIAPHSYLVLAQFLTEFQTYFPNVTNVIGDFVFGLSGGGELIRLFDDNEVLIDFVEYDDEAPWPTEPDGNGPTLELKNPFWDNNLPASWAASIPPTGTHGTPGEVNSTNVLGIDEFNTYKVVIYPNPMSERAIVSIDDFTEELSLVIYDLLGKEIQKYQSTSGEFLIDRKDLNSGIYIVKLFEESNSVIYIQKLIVK